MPEYVAENSQQKNKTVPETKVPLFLEQFFHCSTL